MTLTLIKFICFLLFFSGTLENNIEICVSKQGEISSGEEISYYFAVDQDSTVELNLFHMNNKLSWFNAHLFIGGDDINIDLGDFYKETKLQKTFSPNDQLFRPGKWRIWIKCHVSKCKFEVKVCMDPILISDYAVFSLNQWKPLHFKIPARELLQYTISLQEGGIPKEKIVLYFSNTTRQPDQSKNNYTTTELKGSFSNPIHSVFLTIQLTSPADDSRYILKVVDCSLISDQNICLKQPLCKIVSGKCVPSCSSLNYPLCSNKSNCEPCDTLGICVDRQNLIYETNCPKCIDLNENTCGATTSCQYCSSLSKCVPISEVCSACKQFDLDSCKKTGRCAICGTNCIEKEENCHLMSQNLKISDSPLTIVLISLLMGLSLFTIGFLLYIRRKRSQKIQELKEFILEQKYEIFLSYTVKDKEKIKIGGLPLVEYLKQELEKKKFSTFLAEKDIKGGENFQEVLDFALQKAKIVIFLYARGFQKSKWTQAEIQSAFRNDKIIIPLLIDDTKFPPQGFDTTLGCLHYRDFREDTDSKISKLIQDVEACLSKSEDLNAIQIVNSTD